MIDWSKYPDFSSDEFECRDCKLCDIDAGIPRRLQLIRDKLNQPITITSGFRCPTQNDTVDGDSKSRHLNGTAVDVSVDSNMRIPFLLEALTLFTSIGVYSGHFHLAIKSEKKVWPGPMKSRRLPRTKKGR